MLLLGIIVNILIMSRNSGQSGLLLSAHVLRPFVGILFCIKKREVLRPFVCILFCIKKREFPSKQDLCQIVSYDTTSEDLDRLAGWSGTLLLACQIFISLYDSNKLFTLKYSDRQTWANSLDPDQMLQDAALIRVYIVCQQFQTHFLLVFGRQVWANSVHPDQMPHIQIQSTLIISNSKGLSEILRDICTSTYEIFRIEEKYFEQPHLTNIYVKQIGLEVRDILKLLWKRGEIAFLLFSTIFLPVVRFLFLGRDQIFTSR